MAIFNVELKKVINDSYEIEIGFGLEDKLISDLKSGLVGNITAIGMSSINQMAANGIAVPIGVITAYFPMIAGFSKPFETVSKYLYTQQINYLLNDLKSTNFTLERVVIISVNIIVLVTCFTIIFRKKGVAA